MTAKKLTTKQRKALVNRILDREVARGQRRAKAKIGRP